MVGIFTAIGLLATMGYQLSMGYTRLEPLLYLKGAVLGTIPFVFVCVLAAAVQVLARSKFIGYLVMILYLIGDDGVGMDQEARERAFSAFFSSKGASGTGLGLHLAYNIVRAHGAE